MYRVLIVLVATFALAMQGSASASPSVETPCVSAGGYTCIKAGASVPDPTAPTTRDGLFQCRELGSGGGTFICEGWNGEIFLLFE